MPHIDCTDFLTEVEAPVDAVFKAMTDLQAWPSWTSVITKVKSRTAGPWREGYKFVMRTSVTSLPIPVTVLELEENRLIAWGARNRLLTIIHRIHFEPLGPDRCRVRNHEFIEGVFAKVAGRFMANRINQFDRQMAADLAARFR